MNPSPETQNHRRAASLCPTGATQHPSNCQCPERMLLQICLAQTIFITYFFTGISINFNLQLQKI